MIIRFAFLTEEYARVSVDFVSDYEIGYFIDMVEADYKRNKLETEQEFIDFITTLNAKCFQRELFMFERKYYTTYDPKELLEVSNGFTIIINTTNISLLNKGSFNNLVPNAMAVYFCGRMTAITYKETVESVQEKLNKAIKDIISKSNLPTNDKYVILTDYLPNISKEYANELL